MSSGILAKKNLLRSAIVASLLISAPNALANDASDHARGEAMGPLPISDQLPDIDSLPYASANFQAQRSALGYGSEMPSVMDVGADLPAVGARRVPAVPAHRAAAPQQPMASTNKQARSVTRLPSPKPLSHIELTPTQSAARRADATPGLAEFSNSAMGMGSAPQTMALQPRTRHYQLPEVVEDQRQLQTPRSWPHRAISGMNHATIQSIEDGRTLASVGDHVTIDHISAPIGSMLRAYGSADENGMSHPTAELKVMRAGSPGVAVIQRAIEATRLGDAVMAVDQIDVGTQSAMPLEPINAYAYTPPVSSVPTGVSNIDLNYAPAAPVMQATAYGAHQGSGHGMAMHASVIETPGSTIGAIPNGLVYIDSGQFKVGDVLDFSDKASQDYAQAAPAKIKIVSIDGQYSVGRVLSSNRPVEVGFSLIR